MAPKINRFNDLTPRAMDDLDSRPGHERRKRSSDPRGRQHGVETLGSGSVG
jgi:hypothetical protein